MLVHLLLRQLILSTPATILIVDDIDSNRETLRELLDSQGHRFIEAANGTTALRLASETPPDLVLLDVMMPGMSGYEVCRQIRANARLAEVPVIMITALDDQESRLAGIEAGADDFVTKPFNGTEMRARVRSITRLNRYRLLHESQAALRECNERFRLMVENVKDYAIIMLDEHGHIVNWNAGAERIKGYRADEIIGQHFSRFYPAEDIERGKPEHELEVAIAEGRYEEEGWRVRKDGSRFIANTVITALFEPANRLRGFVKITRDISDRKRMDQLLFDNEERIRLALDSAKMGTFEWDMTSNCVTWSRRHEEMWGLAPGEFRGTHEAFMESLHREDIPGIEAAVARCIAERECFLHEFRVVWPDGSIHWITARGNFEYNAEGQPIRMRGTAIDITERKQTEVALSKAEERLRQSQKMDALGQLAGGVAHDFNNQLSVILGYANLLDSQVELPKLKKYVENICKAVQRSADLTRNLLAFARKGQNQSLPVHVHSLIVETVEMLDRTIDKRIEIKKLFNASSDVVLGDPSQLQHALLNLGVNARDAMATGGSLVFETELLNIDDEFLARHSGEIKVGQYIKISVSDTGSGMTEEVKKHLFEPFFTTKLVGKGTGLGLASVYGTIKNHKGTLDVYSEFGHGTTFKLYLPLAEQTKSQQVMAQKDISSGKLSAVKDLCVLLVEDEEILRILFSDMLSTCGIKCFEAKNGRHAVEMYQQLWPQIDIVILDMIMPEMDGPDAFRAMKKINPDIRAMLATGFSLNNEIQAVLDEGVMGFIHKPFMKNELIEKIIEVMR